MRDKKLVKKNYQKNLFKKSDNKVYNTDNKKEKGKRFNKKEESV